MIFALLHNWIFLFFLKRKSGGDCRTCILINRSRRVTDGLGPKQKETNVWHIDIIIRQVTSKVRVSEDGMSSVFLAGELIGLLWAERQYPSTSWGRNFHWQTLTFFSPNFPCNDCRVYSADAIIKSSYSFVATRKLLAACEPLTHIFVSSSATTVYSVRLSTQLVPHVC